MSIYPKVINRLSTRGSEVIRLRIKKAISYYFFPCIISRIQESIPLPFLPRAIFLRRDMTSSPGFPKEMAEDPIAGYFFEKQYLDLYLKRAYYSKQLISFQEKKEFSAKVLATRNIIARRSNSPAFGIM